MITKELVDKYCNNERFGISFDDFVYNIIIEKVNSKDANLSWQDVADIVGMKFGVYHSRHYYSRRYKDMTTEKNCSDDECVLDEEEYIEEDPDIVQEAKDILFEAQKERVKIQDERNQNRAYIRRLAREDTIKEIALEAAARMNKEKMLSIEKFHTIYFSPKEKEAILLLSDWHYGMDVNLHWNTYNPDIAKQRVSKLVEEVIRRCNEEAVSTLHVLNLGDLIAGRIHLPIRLESRIDVIQQIMEVSELLAETLNTLSSYIEEVHYYSCTDNHSRIEPDKTQSLDLESLCRITDWYLKERLGTSVIFHDNIYSEDIITLNVMGHNIIAVHGDKDKPSDAISKLSNFTRQIYDAVLMSHRHHFSADEECGTLVIGNGALMGTDAYSKSLRLHSSPSQTLIFTTEERVADSIVRIVLH